MSKTRMGRPPKSGKKPMGERLEIRLESGEKAAYERAAKSAGMERSDWIRAVLSDAANGALKTAPVRVKKTAEPVGN